MKKQLALALIASGLLFSCRSHNAAVNEIKDEGITFQASQLEDTSKNGVTYKARLTLDKKLAEAETAAEKTALNYKMDSCFYIDKANAKVYAAMVQPIANGISGSYEYLLEFELDKNEIKDSIILIYQDKYINQKSYTLKLAKEE